MRLIGLAFVAGSAALCVCVCARRVYLDRQPVCVAVSLAGVRC